MADRPIRITHVVFALGVGGLETGLINLLRRLRAPDFEHQILCMKDLGANTEAAREAGASVELVGSLEGANRGIIWALRRRIRHFRPHIVHSRNFGTVDAILAARLAGVGRVIHGEHGWDVPDLYGTSRKRRLVRGVLSPLVRRYVTVSYKLADWLLEHRGRFRGKITTIHNGVDLARYEQVPRPDRPPRHLGTVGRLAEVKDQVSLVRAFAALAEDHPAARLSIIGDGPVRPRLEEEIAATGCAERIALPGFRTDTDRVYGELDLFVLPSLNEGISNTILEAMASGLPVVASEVGGNPELVVPGETGSLFPAGDPVALERVLRGYLEDPERVAREGRAARRRAIAAFSLDRMAEEYARLYREVAGAV